jgi:hypothetical protein
MRIVEDDWTVVLKGSGEGASSEREILRLGIADLPNPHGLTPDSTIRRAVLGPATSTRSKRRKRGSNDTARSPAPCGWQMKRGRVKPIRFSAIEVHSALTSAS